MTMSSEDENFALKLLLLPVGAAAKKYIESEEPTVVWVMDKLPVWVADQPELVAQADAN